MNQSDSGTRGRVSVPHILALAGIMLAAYMIVLSGSGKSVLDGNNYNSYSIQTRSWLEGRLDVDYRSWLELAEYNGKYYISFPPVPSVLMLPFALLFGESTPDNLLCLIAAFVGALFALKTALALGKSADESLFWALFVTIASNFLFISMTGWVWFIAQNFSFMFSMGAVYYAVHPGPKRGWLSLLLIACAVGCRPFQAVFIPVIILLLYDSCKRETPAKTLAAYWRWLVPAGCVALFIFVLNLARFGNIFEFGHNYLPEFMESPKGQFGISYVPGNILRSLRLFEYSGGSVSIPRFNSFAFYFVIPIYTSCALHAFSGGSAAAAGSKPRDFSPRAIFGRVRARMSAAAGRLGLTGLVCVACVFLNLLLTCSHKTMGGWHFGCRYFVDATPFVYLLALRLSDKEKLSRRDIALFALGVIVNIAGTAMFYNG